MPARYTIGSLAREAGVGVETVRYYQRRGLVGEPDRPPGGFRHYTSADVKRLRFIRQAQALGFTLDEVTDLLTLEDGRSCSRAEQVGSRKLAVVRERMAQLQRIERALTELVDRCHSSKGKVRCPLIAALGDDETMPVGSRNGGVR